VVGIAVLVIALFALRSPNGHGTHAAVGNPSASSTAKRALAPTSSPKPTTSSTSADRPAPRPSSSPAPAAKLPLVVLNNTTTTGLAQVARTRFEAGGWTVTSTGNLVNNILSTCAYYDPAQAGALAAAQALQAQFPAIKRVVPKFAQLPPGPIVVVLTSDYS
jgi:LytR cell envelope-related transcriptional attenuator